MMIDDVLDEFRIGLVGFDGTVFTSVEKRGYSH